MRFKMAGYLLVSAITCFAQISPQPVSVPTSTAAPKGKLFIIGGGERTMHLMKQLVDAAGLGPSDYVAVLPMSSEDPDSSFFYIKEDLQPACSNQIVNLNFTAATVTNRARLDSLTRAKLIFITGGDQIRFMKVVLNTPVYEAIHKAYENGSTISGTSAGAAVMSRRMITGNQLTGDTTYHETFRKLKANNIEFKEGLGLLDSTIVDQHFIVRSRYNRLFSALALYPNYTCIGIDESTAIIVHGSTVTVAGDGQVILVAGHGPITVSEQGLIKFKDMRLSVYTDGESFPIKP